MNRILSLSAVIGSLMLSGIAFAEQTPATNPADTTAVTPAKPKKVHRHHKKDKNAAKKADKAADKPAQ